MLRIAAVDDSPEAAILLFPVDNSSSFIQIIQTAVPQLYRIWIDQVNQFKLIIARWRWVTALESGQMERRVFFCGFFFYIVNDFVSVFNQLQFKYQ